MTNTVGVLGTGGFAREVLPLVKAAYSKENICFVEHDNSYCESIINLTPVLTESSFLSIIEPKVYVNTIAAATLREKIALLFKSKKVGPLSVSASSVKKLDNVSIGEGSILCDNVILTSNIKIGDYFHANIYSYVGHDCIIEDYVTFAPRVSCNGNVHIKKGAYIGAGAIIKQGRSDKPLIIGEGAIIGMGAVVTKDVPPRTTVIGNPAKELIKN